MTDIITDAVRAGCQSLMSPGSTCPFPYCQCADYGDKQIALETSARHAASAMRERAAQLTDKAAEQISKLVDSSTDEDIAACLRVHAAAIRAIPIKGEKP